MKHNLHSVSRQGFERALVVSRSSNARSKPKTQLERRHRFENIVGESEAIRQVFDIIEKVADTDSTILIMGESGTGKELVAKAIHFNGHRRDGPFVTVNCGIPEGLLESELFGHERGSFTNAFRSHIGRFELANGGTIFLDEVGDISPNFQVKILRVLQEHQFERVGTTKTIKTDIQVISATNQNLRQKVLAESFREDLYHRLNVIPIRIPPLRERKSDIPLLVHHFLRRLNRTRGKNIKAIASEAMNYLMEYHWSGNVRELENFIERLVVLTGEGTITLKHVLEAIPPALQDPGPFRVHVPREGLCFNSTVAQFEKELILEVLDRTGWVKTEAARLLHLNRNCLVKKMRRMNLLKGSGTYYWRQKTTDYI